MAEILPLSPSSGEYIEDEDFSMIFVSVDSTVALECGQVEMLLDNVLLLIQCQRDSRLITATISPQIKSGHSWFGEHHIVVRIKNIRDSLLAQRTWSFICLKPFNDTTRKTNGSHNWGHNGRINAQWNSHVYNSQSAGYLSTAASYSGYSGKLRYAANAYLTTNNEHSTQDQNIYSAEVGYGRSIELKVGDTRPDFIPLTLSGQRVRGVELNSRIFTRSGGNPLNIDIAWGQAARAYESDDSLVASTYSRTLLAVRAGFGSGEVFQFGLSMLKAKDDTSSITRIRDSVVQAGADTIYIDAPSAKDNLVLGADLSSWLFNRRFELFVQYAFSLYTRNINDGVITKDQLEKIFGNTPLDLKSFSWLLVINTSSTPLYPSVEGFFGSSMLKAGAGLTLPLRSVFEQIRFTYELQGSNFYSLGNPMLGSPRHGYTINEKINLLDNRLTLGVDFNRYENNFEQTQTNPTITSNFSIFAGLYYAPSFPSLSVGYSLDNVENSDTVFGFFTGVSSINAQSGYSCPLNDITLNFQAYTGWTTIANEWKLNEYDSLHHVSDDTTMEFATGVYGLNCNGEFKDLPLSLSAGYAGNSGGGASIKLQTGTLSARYTIVRDLLTANAGTNIGSSTVSGQSASKIFWKLFYGIELLHASGHQLRYNGSLVTQGSSKDCFNAISYEWRF